MAAADDGSKSPVTVQVTKLQFTYPGIDGAPPPGAKPLIQDFSLTLHAGDRCLLVGANGAGTVVHLKFSRTFFLASSVVLGFRVL